MNQPFLRNSVQPVEGELPSYLRETYTWAYLTPKLAAFFDHQPVVEVILWGNGVKLADLACSEIAPGSRVMQPAAVYGVFSKKLAEAVGPTGWLEVRDVAPLQIDRTRRKLAGYPRAALRLHDAAVPDPTRFDAVVCFFLLHEVPDDVKRQVIRAMLQSVETGGKVIFVDYHGPSRFHPLKQLMSFINWWLEPFAARMWKTEIKDMAGSAGDAFEWRKTTRFGGLYQMVVATRK